ncbi:MAG TPA: NAD(P)/FAD-dependent oxidoreductase [Pseudonocardia sp.]|nr:NAD(P)/FAD-dependent oxidoreductase [Pseudonocardia sp.]
MRDDYDAVVVGARCAGSATALLMARAGLRVLLLDRVHPARDTLSTHALMRGGVLQLDRWGLLPRIIAAGTPAVTGTTFDYGDEAETIRLGQPLYAPRRTVLDGVLLDAALDAGVEARFGVDVTGLTSDRTGRVTGVLTRVRGGGGGPIRAELTVGADGLRSGTAREVRARTTWRGAAASAIVYGYWPSPSSWPHYRWFYRPGSSAGIIPTKDGQVCIWAGLPAARFADERRDGLDALLARTLARVAPEAAELVAAGGRTEPVRGFPGAPARLRQAVGAGWALVGDAGSFKDPLTAHGITDALRDAELLARAAVVGTPAAFGGYQRIRDELTVPLLEVAEQIVGYRWGGAEIRPLLLAESAAMKPEVAYLRGLDVLAPERRAA